MRRRRGSRAFTLIELLIVVAIIALLISVLLPSLSAARAQGRAAKCLAQLRVFGHGMAVYANENRDVMVGGRLPKLDACNWYAEILGGTKFRPNFAAMLGRSVGMPPFREPARCENIIDSEQQPGSRQNFASPLYICPEVADWSDERNFSYGYNYHFLGNSRLSDSANPTSFKNWPVSLSKIRHAALTVAVADSMGTAATVPIDHRVEYENNGNNVDAYGNEGFNLDPPRIDPFNGEAAGYPDHRTSVDPRHRGKGSVLWVDGHARAETLRGLGYKLGPGGEVEFDGNNAQWTGNHQDLAWTPGFQY